MMDPATKPSVEANIRDLYSMCDVRDSPFTTEEEQWIRHVFDNCIYGRSLVLPTDIKKLQELREKLRLHLAKG